MGLQRTIGGDRLGSGNKMKQTLHSYERSTHDLSRAWRSTLQVGCLTPCLCLPVVNGDTIEMHIDHRILTAAPNGPTFGQFKVQVDFFSVPYRLYMGLLHNNAVKVGMDMKQIMIPQLYLQETALTKEFCDTYQIDFDSSQVSPSALLHYLGIKGLGARVKAGVNNSVNIVNGTVARQFDATAMLAYYDIFKCYYSNKQEDKAYVITPGITSEQGSPATAIWTGGFAGSYWGSSYGQTDIKGLWRGNPYTTNTYYELPVGSDNEQEINVLLKERGMYWRGNWNASGVSSPARVSFRLKREITELDYNNIQITLGWTGGNAKGPDFGTRPDEPTMPPSSATATQGEVVLTLPQAMKSLQILDDGTITGILKLNELQQNGYIVANQAGNKLAVNIKSIVYVQYDYNGSANGIQLTPFALENIDKMRRILLRQDKGTPINMGITPNATPQTQMYPYMANWQTYSDKWTTDKLGDEASDPVAFGYYKNALNGLCVKTYQSDMFNNWLNTDWILGSNGINAITNIDVSQGYLNLDALNIAQKAYNILNRVAIAGGTYEDWQEAAYGVDAVRRVESPVYLGGQSSELKFDEIFSTGGSEPIGTLAGKGFCDEKKGGHIIFKADEPGIIMGIISITPRIDYSQGNTWTNQLGNLDNLHKPGFDAIGYQDLVTEQMHWADAQQSSDQIEKFQVTKFSAGKQPSWIEYQTAVNECHGDFAEARKMMYMTLNRRYEIEQVGAGTSISDLTTYIEPEKYNYIFANRALGAQNFWAQVVMNIEARRIMSANQIPNL